MALAIGAIQHLAKAPVGAAECENPYCPATTQHRLSDFMRDLKASTSKHFNETSGLIHKIGWQDGYGAFTVGKSQEDTVRRYIANQEQHHAKETFQVEYVRLDMLGPRVVDIS